MHASRVPTEEDTSCTSEDEGRAGHDEGNGSVEAESLDDTMTLLAWTRKAS
jgi:hypothetical protein